MSAAIAKRSSKRKLIEEFFAANLGTPFPSSALHQRFGPAFRSRVSEINCDPAAAVTISNAVSVKADGAEESMYWAEVRR
jgi:hypothetical protein